MPERIGFARPVVNERPRKTAQRGYGADWRRVRRMALIRDMGLCQDCLEQGRTRAATDGHHVRKIDDAPHLRLDVDNVRMLCKECHDARTARGE